MLMTSGEITKLTNVPCIFLPVILLTVTHHSLESWLRKGHLNLLFFSSTGNCNQQIKTKYFDHGLKEHLAEDYYFVGQIAATALLQNGQAPKYFSEELLNDIFVSDELASSKCVSKLHQGLDTPGIHSLKYKKAVCSKFVKYLQDVTSGRTVTTLENILELATGASEEQLLGFTQQPSIYFMVPYVPARKTTEDNISEEQVNISM